MTAQIYLPPYRDYLEYHGNTMIERSRKRGEFTVSREWLLFDSVEDATDYFNENCGLGEVAC